MEKLGSEDKWYKPNLCARCVYLCPWNGKGYGCSHPEIRRLLEGQVRCEGCYFIETRALALGQ